MAGEGLQTLHRYQYGYDAAGNRLYAHVEQVGHVNDRSYAYTYDALSRLRSADLGELGFSGPEPEINRQSGVPSRYHTWTPDLLGNWAGDATNSGFQRAIDQDGDGEMDTWADIWHATDAANEIRSIRTDIEGQPAIPKPVVYDRAGNLVWDSAYLYLYDGFNPGHAAQAKGASLARGKPAMSRSIVLRRVWLFLRERSLCRARSSVVCSS